MQDPSTMDYKNLKILLLIPKTNMSKKKILQNQSFEFRNEGIK